MLLEDLKQKTRQHHQRLEALNGLPTTQSEYVELLETFHGFVVPWEKQLASRLPVDDPVRAGRDKSAWLEADLEHFDYSPESRSALPTCPDLPSTTTRAEILGACYVLEGSTLGGQFISRHLESNLGLSDGRGYRYFRSYGPEVRAKWQAFQGELLRHAARDHDAIVAAAQDTFEKLATWFAMCRARTA